MVDGSAGADAQVWRRRLAVLYVGDVTVEPSIAGSALLWRLFEGFPIGQLTIVEAGFQGTPKGSRLSDVEYIRFPLPPRRLCFTRFGQLYGKWLLSLTPMRARALGYRLGTRRFDVVVSVAHGYSWLVAYWYAAQRGLPFCIVLHDDWFTTIHTSPDEHRWAEALFRCAYQYAAIRLCASPYMKSKYDEQYGAAHVMLPFRARTSPKFFEPPARLRLPAGEVVFVYAGSITPGYAANLRLLGRVLARRCFKLVVFCGAAERRLMEGKGVAITGIEVRDLLPQSELIQYFRSCADVLVVTMSFNPDDREAMEMGFPSKFTEYTAVGVPVLVWGPEYCSAVRWARTQEEFAQVVDSLSEAALAEACGKLVQDPAYMYKLGRAALSVGEEFFSYQAGVKQFYRHLEGIVDSVADGSTVRTPTRV